MRSYSTKKSVIVARLCRITPQTRVFKPEGIPHGEYYTIFDRGSFEVTEKKERPTI